jgi:CHAD domain-containing protein
MSYQLRRDETLGDGLQRICRKQVELALAITTGDKEVDDTPVHQTRKHLKKARAALRLVKKEIGRGLFRRQDHCLRNVGRLISEIRDAEVRLQTVQQLQSISRRQKRRSYQKIEQTLLLEMESFIAAFAEWQTQAAPILERVRGEIENWPVDHFDYKEMCRCVQATYKRGRNALADAKRTPTAECFHIFRTETKQLGYQLRILRPVNPVVLKNLTDELKSLGGLLGRAHDLSFLGQRLRDESTQTEWHREGQELLAIIEASESDLQRGAADLAERFYAERPRNFGARVRTWLDNWMAGSPSMAEELVNEGTAPVASVQR